MKVKISHGVLPADSVGQFGAALPANLEAAIHGRADAPSTYEVATIIAVATLLLNIAKFAWDIHEDNLKSAAAPTQDSMARRIRMEVTLPDRCFYKTT